MSTEPETNTAPELPALRQPRPVLRWIAVVLAAAGWYVSFTAYRISAGQTTGGVLVELACGKTEAGKPTGCTNVLRSPRAYFHISENPNAPTVPTALLGMAYFAVLGLWFLFVGPPARNERLWHLLPAVTVIFGAIYSGYAVYEMKSVLRQWCAVCLTAHALNAGMIVVTGLAWPIRRPKRPTLPHPTTRLALATVLLAALAFVTQFALTFMFIAGSMLTERTKAYAEVVKDPAFIVWDHERQPAAHIEFRPDELFAGNPDAPHTLVVFSDFQCTACRASHETLMKVNEAHAGQLRIAFRYFPLDPTCNPSPDFGSEGHPAGCQAARAAEAAKRVGGRDAYLAMRKLMWERQRELPNVPFERQTREQRELFDRWAGELGLDVAAFRAAMASDEVAARISDDIALGNRLELHALPALYLDGRRMRHWSDLATWDALLATPATSQPATQPNSP